LIKVWDYFLLMRYNSKPKPTKTTVAVTTEATTNDVGKDSGSGVGSGEGDEVPLMPESH
jgi:hypothetical protein